MSDDTVQHEKTVQEKAPVNRAERRKAGQRNPFALRFHAPKHRTGAASLYTHIVTVKRGQKARDGKRTAIAQVAA